MAFVAVFLSGCFLGSLEPPLADRGAVLTISVSDTAEVAAQPELGERISTGEGAVGGVFGGAGGALYLAVSDPSGISFLLLPVTVPAGMVLGGVFGAVSAPSDEEWAEMMAYHERSSAALAGLQTIVDSIDKDAKLEDQIVQRIKALPKLAATCVRTRRQGFGCPISDSTPKLVMQVETQIEPLLHEKRKGLFGKKTRIESYIVKSILNVRITVPQQQVDRCYKASFNEWLTPDEMGGRITREHVEALFDTEYRRIAAELVMNLFEMPALDEEDRSALFRQRYAEFNGEVLRLGTRRCA